MTRTALVVVQALTYAALAILLVCDRDWRLAASQALLAAVAVLIYL